MRELLLTNEEREEILNSQIFIKWLSGMDESELTEYEKLNIMATQLYIDQILPDEKLLNTMKLIPCKNQYHLISDKICCLTACSLLGVAEDILIKKVALMNLRQLNEVEEENDLIIKQFNEMIGMKRRMNKKVTI